MLHSNLEMWFSEQLKLLNAVDEVWSNSSDSGMERFIAKEFDEVASNITAYIQQAKVAKFYYCFAALSFFCMDFRGSA